MELKKKGKYHGGGGGDIMKESTLINESIIDKIGNITDA